MSKELSAQVIRMYIYSSVVGAASSFGFFMFAAWLCMFSFDKTSLNPYFYPFSIALVILFVISAVLTVLWIVSLTKQKSKLKTAGISALFACAGLTVGFAAFLIFSAMSIMD